MNFPVFLPILLMVLWLGIGVLNFLLGKEDRLNLGKFFERSPFGMALVTSRGEFLKVNAKASKILGYSSGEMATKNLEDLLSPCEAALLSSICKKLHQNPEETVEIEREAIHQSGKKIYLFLSFSLLSSPSLHSPSPQILCQFQNITGFRDAARDNIQVHESLEVGLEFLQKLLDRQTKTVYLLDLAGNFLFLNHHSVALTGYSHGELLGQNFSILFSPQVAPQILDVFTRVTQQEETVNHFEAEFIRKGGEKTLIVFNAAPLYQGGKVAGMVGLAEDIKEAKDVRAKLREGQKKFQLVANQIPAIIWTIDTDWIIRSTGGAGLAKMGLQAADLEGTSLREVLGADESKLPLSFHQRALEGEKVTYEMDWHGRFFKVRVEPLRDDRGKISGCIGLALDITENRQMEEALKKNQRTLSTLMDNLPGMAYRCQNDPLWTMEFVSQGGEQITGYPVEELVENGRINYSDLIHPEDQVPVGKTIQKALVQQKAFYLTYRIFDGHGGQKWVWEKGRGIFNPEGELEALEGFILDITPKKRAEHLIELQNKILEKIVQGGELCQTLEELCALVQREALDLLFPFKQGGDGELSCHVLSLEKGKLHIRASSLRSAKKRKELEIFFALHHPTPCETALQKKELLFVPHIQKTDQWDEFQKFIHPLGMETFWVSPLLSRLGKPLGVLVLASSFSYQRNVHIEEIVQSAVRLACLAIEHKKREEKLHHSLAEKKSLLQEIHHRVKNNLQIMSSLLNLQSRSTDNAEAIQLLQNNRSRIHSMAMIHEMLYQSIDFCHINFSQYLRLLSQYLLRIHGSPSHITLKVQSDPIDLEIQTAIPIALILSELVTNALKYAFPDQRQGTIDLRFSPLDSGELSLVVRDDGVGIPPEVPLNPPSTFGLKLVHSLTNQLDGRLKISREKGTTLEVCFVPE